MKISPSRTSAFDVLFRIETERAYSSVLLPAYGENLSARDRALCYQIVLGVLRRQISLDRVIDEYARGKKLDIEVMVALRMGLFQLSELTRVPAHSAISESVELTARARKASAKGFVNALLRRFTREGESFDLTGHSHPDWLIDRWTRQFGRERALSIADANNAIPKTCFRIVSDGELALSAVAVASPSELVQNAWIAERVTPEITAAAEAGEIYIQDEGSQLVAAAVTIPLNGNFLDVCAAPGGKTTMIAKRFGIDAGILAAGDIHAKRMAHLSETCDAQVPGRVAIVQYDAAEGLPFADQAFDTVFVDAPCSGTGTIRHNPEIRYFIRESDIAELSYKQLTILENASKLVKRGGSLTYSTCSLERDENEEVIERFLAAATDFDRVMPAVREAFVTEAGSARTWPDRDEMDGFFIAELRRKA